MKKRIALLAALAVVVGSVFAGLGAASTGSTKASTKARTITVTATDFHFRFITLGRLNKGVPYIFKLVNKGAALHNFDIQGVKATKVIPHGKTVSMTVVFKKAGKYQYLCDVPRHAELGMAGTLTVK